MDKKEKKGHFDSHLAGEKKVVYMVVFRRFGGYFLGFVYIL